MDVADPMPDALEQPQLIGLVVAGGEIAHVVVDGRHHALCCPGTGRADLDLLGGAGQIGEVLRRSNSRKDIRPCARLAERAKIRVESDERSDFASSLRIELSERNLADDLMAEIAPSHRGAIASDKSKECTGIEAWTHGTVPKVGDTMPNVWRASTL